MTVVLVHGNPESSAVWDPLAERLAEAGAEPPVRLSPPGFGSALLEDFDCTPAGYRDWLIGELAGLGGPVDLVGHDWGGLHVAAAVMHRPDLVRSWTSDALGVLHPDYVWHPLARQWQTPSGERWVAEQLGLDLQQRAVGLEELGVDAGISHALAAAFDADMGRAILALYRAAAQPSMARVGEHVEALRTRPGLAILATADDAVGTRDQRRATADRAGAAVHEIEAGHWWLTVEDGRPGADALLTFWREQT